MRPEVRQKCFDRITSDTIKALVENYYSTTSNKDMLETDILNSAHNALEELRKKPRHEKTNPGCNPPRALWEMFEIIISKDESATNWLFAYLAMCDVTLGEMVDHYLRIGAQCA
jgi:hypothetical protein